MKISIYKHSPQIILSYFMPVKRDTGLAVIHGGSSGNGQYTPRDKNEWNGEKIALLPILTLERHAAGMSISTYWVIAYRLHASIIHIAARNINAFNEISTIK